MRSSTIRTLGANPPSRLDVPLKEQHRRVNELEAKFGLALTSPKNISLGNLWARLDTLEEMDRAGTAAAMPPSPAATPCDPLLKNYAAFIAMRPEDRKQFCADGGRLMRSDFNKLTPATKSEFFRNGGRLADEPRAVAAPVTGNDGMTVNRAAFEAIPHLERAAFFRKGGQVID